MTTASRKEAENFHVLPKTSKDTVTQQKPDIDKAAATNAAHVEPSQNTSLSPNGARDPEAGSTVEDPANNSQANQPLDAPRRSDQSQVS